MVYKLVKTAIKSQFYSNQLKIKKKEDNITWKKKDIQQMGKYMIHND